MMRLDSFDNSYFRRGRSRFVEVLWVLFGLPIFSCRIPGSSWRSGLLRLFGGTVGVDVVWKPRVIVKFPWRLSIGSFSWVGEAVWIDNLDFVAIGEHVCISQGAYLCTGSHDWSKTTFDLITKPIRVESGVWVCARSIICPGAVLMSGSVLSVGSVARGTLEKDFIYRGNFAEPIGVRKNL